jgi:hypothetical protein
VYAVSILSVDSTVLESDRAADQRLGTQAGEQKRQQCPDCARQESACDQTLFHAAGLVAGEAEQMACVVYELVHVGVTAEQ